MDNFQKREKQYAPSKVGSNPLIVEKILESFPAHALKTARLVSHLWNSEAVKILPNRKIVLSICHVSPSDDGSDSVVVSEFDTSYLNPAQFPRWRIQLPQDITWRAESTAKVLRHLTIFLSQHPQTHVTSLHLAGGFGTEESLNIFSLVMASFKDSITSLYLEQFTWTADSHPSLDLKFSALRFLSLGVDAGLNASTNTTSFLDGFLPAAKDISTLQLQRYKRNSHTVYTSVLRWISRAQEVDQVGMFKNLKHIRSDVTAGSLNTSLVHLQRSSLKTLAWGGLRSTEWPLSCQNESLEELTLQLKQGTAVNIIDFPAMMRKLKRLSIFVHSREVAELDMTVRFGGQNAMTFLEYASNRLHSLESLTIWPVDSNGLPEEDEVPICTSASWGKFLPVLAAFLPIRIGMGGVTPFPYLRHLDIPFLLRGKYHQSLDGLETFFPNVAFPLKLATARAGPVWNPDEEQDDVAGMEDSGEEEEEKPSSEDEWD